MKSLIRLLVVAFVVAACTSGDAVTTTTSLSPSTTAASTTSSRETTTTTPSTTTLPPGVEDLSAEMQADIVELIAITEELRGLTFLRLPTVVVVDREELGTRVRESIAEDTADIPADQALLRLLGLIEPDVDLLAVYLDLYGEQVLGYYDGQAGELVVPAGETLSALQKATLVHEFTHALTDQRFGTTEAYREMLDEDRFDEAVAFLSVMEGDATLVEVLYMQRLGLEEQQELLGELFETESPAFDAAPPFLQRSLVFPYEAGFAFVQRAFESGGFDEVNRLYLEPPVSSEQIRDPRAYLRDLPLAVDPFAVELSGYDEVYSSVWGELSFDLMFDQVLGGADEAVAGWGGDAYVQWFDGTEAAIALRYIGDEPSDSDEMYQALVRYVTAAMAVDESVETSGGLAFSGEDFAFVRLGDDGVVFVAAGNPGTGERIVAALP